MSKPWHCVSMRLACGCVLVPTSPPNRHVANEMSPSAARRDRLVGHLHRAGVAMVEVDGEEQAAILGFLQQPVGLVEIEHERLLDEQRDSPPR